MTNFVRNKNKLYSIGRRQLDYRLGLSFSPNVPTKTTQYQLRLFFLTKKIREIDKTLIAELKKHLE